MFLFGLNLSGLFLPLRNPAIYHEPKTSFPNDITLPEAEVLQRIRKRDEPVEDYVRRLNDTINRGIAHYWSDEGIDTYHMRIPAYENYLLWIAGYIRPENYRKFEFCCYKRAIRRGIGLCSQVSIIVSEILKENGIRAGIVRLDGHVVATAEVGPGFWWILDPDYGVVVPRSLQEIEQDPGLVKGYYQAQGYSEKTSQYLAGLYEKKGNGIVPGVREYFSRRKCYTETAAYTLIWIIPALLILPYLIQFVRIFFKSST